MENTVFLNSKTGQYKNTQTQAQRQNEVEKEKQVYGRTKYVTYSTKQIYIELESWGKSRKRMEPVAPPLPPIVPTKQNVAHSGQYKQKQNHTKAHVLSSSAMSDSLWPWTAPHQPLHGILQARILEWLQYPPPGDFLDPGMEPVFLATPSLQADCLPLPTREAHIIVKMLTTKMKRKITIIAREREHQ